MKMVRTTARASLALALAVLTLSTLTFAQGHRRDHHSVNDDSMVLWKSIKGNITAPGVDNPVAGISAGTLPWTTTQGRARVDLLTGATSFEVEGLVNNGGNASGSTGPVDQVEGSLICNAGGDPNAQVILTSSPVPLSSTGDAEFSGNIGTVPSPCANPLFLIRIGPDLPGANQRWIATGAVLILGDED